VPGGAALLLHLAEELRELGLLACRQRLQLLNKAL
jgi:hypothetical protein